MSCYAKFLETIEVNLIEPTGTRDYSGIGESANYPTGYGCEACS